MQVPVPVPVRVLSQQDPVSEHKVSIIQSVPDNEHNSESIQTSKRIFHLIHFKHVKINNEVKNSIITVNPP